MYFKTKQDSEIGKKFAALSEKLKCRKEAIIALQEKYGFTETYVYHPSFGSGISAVNGFKEAPTQKIWRKTYDRKNFYPSTRTKEGKSILEEFAQVPKISDTDINGCICYNGGPFHIIGYNLTSEDGYYKFEVMKEWGCTIPNDCEEIYESEYL